MTLKPFLEDDEGLRELGGPGYLVRLAGAAISTFAARDYASYNFNYTSLVVVALFFIVLTVPLARFTDWLQRRVAERERAGAL